MRDEYNLLNNVGIDFSQYEIEEVSEFEKKRMMKKFIDSKNKKRLWNKKKISMVVVALLFAVSLGINGDKVLAVMGTIKKINKKGDQNVSWYYFRSCITSSLPRKLLQYRNVL